MRDLTNEIPKPMLKVQGRPILEHILEGLVAAGIHDVCIITGWHAEVIEGHFGDGSKFGARIAYARQEVRTAPDAPRCRRARSSATMIFS